MESTAGADRMFGGFGGGGHFGGFGHPGHPEHHERPGAPDRAGPEMARGPHGGFPPPPPHPPQPPGPGGPGGFPGFGGFPGGDPRSGGWFGDPRTWQRFLGNRGSRPAARPVRPAVLALLTEEPMHGYQLMQEIRRRTHDQWRPSPGSVYPILQQLEDEGLVRTVESGGRRVAELTEAGREHVAGREEEFASLWESGEEELDDDRFPALWRQLGELSGAAAQVGYSGTDAQVAQVRKILADARRRVYAVLAEEEPEES